jgi:hypothetical protein
MLFEVIIQDDFIEGFQYRSGFTICICGVLISMLMVGNGVVPYKELYPSFIGWYVYANKQHQAGANWKWLH